MAQEEIERTEAPSPRWIAASRERGHWPYSGELVIALAMLAGVLALRLGGDRLADQLLELTRNALLQVDLDRSPDELVWLWRMDLYRPLRSGFSILLFPVVAAIVAGAGQVGLRLNFSSLMPDLSRLNVVRGLQRIFSTDSALEALVRFAKGLVLAGLGAWWLCGYLVDVRMSLGQTPDQFTRQAAGTILGVTVKLALATAILGAADYARAWWRWLQQMRMSRAELKAEMRELEGDSGLRRRRRQQQFEAARRRVERALDHEDLVFIGKGRLIVVARAARHGATRVVTRAIGPAADRLHRSARNCGARLIRNDSLARAIYRAGQSGTALSSELSAAVATARR